MIFGSTYGGRRSRWTATCSSREVATCVCEAALESRPLDALGIMSSLVVGNCWGNSKSILLEGEVRLSIVENRYLWRFKNKQLGSAFESYILFRFI